jgi:hypothetical protein
LERLSTYERAAEDDDDGDGGMGLREFLLGAAIGPYVLHVPQAVPPALLEDLGAALEPDSLRRAVGGSGSGSLAVVAIAELFGAARDHRWTDLIDLDLCLADAAAEDGSRQWQTADVEVDQEGRVRWASWVNHLDAEGHGGLLSGLEAVLGLVLPHLERVTRLRLRGRRLQFVVGSFEHALAPSPAEKGDEGGSLTS